MKKICIISWDAEGQRLYDLIRDVYDVSCVVERDHTLWGKHGSGFDIVSFSSAYKQYREKQIEKFIIPGMRGIVVKTGIYDKLIRHGIRVEDILYAPSAVFKNTCLSGDERRAMICLFKDRTELDYLAVHITDHCNLRCANCSVFSPLITKTSFPDRYTTIRAIKRLRTFFDSIQVIRVLGGEPTLNPAWLEYCSFLRNIYPLSDIEVVTNGSRILNLTDEEFDILYSNKITLDISYYPTFGDSIDRIEALLREKNIRHYITQENELFSCLYDFDRYSDPDKNYAVCKMKFMCLNMRENILGTCHAVVGLKRASEHFELNHYADAGVDLFEDHSSAAEITAKLDRSMSICGYCQQDLSPWRIVERGKEFEKSNWSPDHE